MSAVRSRVARVTKATKITKPAKVTPAAKLSPAGKAARLARENAASRRLATLAEVAALVRDRPDPADALRRALDRLAEVVPFENATFFLLDDARGTLVPVATLGEPVDLIPDVQFDLGQGLSSWVARTGRPVLLSDLRGDGREQREGPPRPGSFLSVPLLVQRQPIGVLNAGSRQPGAFSEADRDLLVAAGAALAAPLLARRDAAAAERRPGTDLRTGLPNGPAFALRVAEAIERGRRYGEPCAVAVIEPTRGGDEVLEDLAALLVSRARKSDVVARLTPDASFAILLSHQAPAGARLALERFVAAVERHAFAQRRRVSVRTGLAAWPADGDDALALLARARACAPLGDAEAA